MPLIRDCLERKCPGCSVCEVARIHLASAPEGTVCSECGGLAEGFRRGALGPACRPCEAERLALLVLILDAQGPEDTEPGQQELFGCET